LSSWAAVTSMSVTGSAVTTTHSTRRPGSLARLRTTRLKASALAKNSASRCATEYHRLSDIVAVDAYNQGDLLRVVDEPNGVATASGTATSTTTSAGGSGADTPTLGTGDQCVSSPPRKYRLCVHPARRDPGGAGDLALTRESPRGLGPSSGPMALSSGRRQVGELEE
jgi:hypothetical protein